MALLLVAVVVLLAAAAPAFSKQRWVKITSPNFEMFTSAGEGDGRRTILHFEQIRSFFLETVKSRKPTPLPVRIIAFRSRKEYEPYRPNEFASAYYQSGHDRDYIVMSKISSDTRPIAIHEYVHLLVRHEGLTMPPWLNEGFADLYSTLKPWGGKVVVGEVLPGRLQLLQRKTKWLPLETLTSVDKDSPHYNERNRAGLFYAQSWALTHMLNLSEEYRTRLTEFLSAIAKDTTAAVAFQQVYDKSLEQVQKDLRLYMRQDRFVAAFFDTKLEKNAEKPVVEPATELESGMVLANLLAMTRKQDEARRMYEELAQNHPTAWEVPQALGYLTMWDSGRDEAGSYFARAVELGATNPKLYFDYSGLLSRSGAEDSEAESLLRKAVELKPDYQEARYFLAFNLYNQHKFTHALINFAQLKTVTAERAFTFYRAVAYAYHQVDRKDEARKTAKLAEKYARGPSEIAQVEELIRWMEWAEEAEKAPKTANIRATPLIAADDKIQDEIPRLVRQSRESDEAGRQGFDIEVVLSGPETSSVTGTFTQLDCLGSTARLHVVSENEAMALAILDPTNIVVEGPKAGPVDLNCGPQRGKSIVVQYEAGEDAELGTRGVVKSIVFKE